MSLDLFRLIGGLDIQSDDLSSNANILQGAGLPGGDSGVQDGAPIGSLFMRTDANAGDNNLQLYSKVSTANNSAADWSVISDKAYVDAVANGISWREPVRVTDSTVYANAAAFPTGGTIDGVSLNPDDRVLFSNVTLAGDNNVFIWDGATWTEDSNVETDGDAVLVQEGTSAEQQWVFDGTNWVQFGSVAGSAELGFLRDYVGKTGPGAETPTYTSTNVVTAGTNLENAIGELDAATGNQTFTNDNVVTDGQSTTASIDALDTAIGSQTYTNDNVVTDGETVTASIDSLDTAIGDIQNQTTTINVTNIDGSVTPVTLDTLPLADATEVKWLVQVRENGTPANRRALEVHAMNDGATLVDHTEYAVLKLGSPIAGFDITVDINATDMRLTIAATNTLDVVVRRVAYTAF